MPSIYFSIQRALTSSCGWMHRGSLHSVFWKPCCVHLRCGEVSGPSRGRAPPAVGRERMARAASDRQWVVRGRAGRGAPCGAGRGPRGAARGRYEAHGTLLCDAFYARASGMLALQGTSRRAPRAAPRASSERSALTARGEERVVQLDPVISMVSWIWIIFNLNSN